MTFSLSLSLSFFLYQRVNLAFGTRHRTGDEKDARGFWNVIEATALIFLSVFSFDGCNVFPPGGSVENEHDGWSFVKIYYPLAS